MHLLEKIIKIYIDKFPLEKGKTTLFENYAKWAGLRREEKFETKFGACMLLDLSQYVQRQIYFRGLYEEAVLKQINILDEKFHFDFMIDIGANVGQHSLYVAKQLDIKKIHVFEPCGSTYARLIQNIALNTMGDIITAHNLAASDIKSKVVIKTPVKSNDGGNYIEEVSDNSTREEAIEAVVLDEYFDGVELGGSGLVKIDVEGAEAKVIRGMDRLLSSGLIKTVLIEVCENNLQRFDDSAKYVINKLHSYGMTGYIIDKHTLKPIINSKIPDYCDMVFF